jgi:hypothetical protein
MKQFLLSSLMLLIVIAALVFALMVHYDRAYRRAAELRARLAPTTIIHIEGDGAIESSTGTAPKC